MTTMTMNPIELLKEDHAKVKQLFKEFEQESSQGQRAKIARKAMSALKIHAEIEEKIFYPAFHQKSSAKDADGVYRESMEEHHVQHLLIKELDKMQDDDPEFDAKFTVLAENVRHHIKEEESEMLPQAQKTMDHDLLMDLGDKMAEKKQQMQKTGV